MFYPARGAVLPEQRSNVRHSLGVEGGCFGGGVYLVASIQTQCLRGQYYRDVVIIEAVLPLLPAQLLCWKLQTAESLAFEEVRCATAELGQVNG